MMSDAESGGKGRPAGRPADERAEPEQSHQSAARSPIEIDVLTLFPGMLVWPLAESIPGRVQTRGLAIVKVHDLRQWGLGRHKTVDDYTYGGGAGMVLRPEPVAAALSALRRPGSTVILPDPGGEVFGQLRAHDLSEHSHLIILCPRYEGVDERIRSMVDLELSIGDYVLSGGEIPALVFVDAILRLLPGAIDAESTAEESFTAGLLEYPQFTRPPEFEGVAVPAVLTGGHHDAVRKWRVKEALRRTLARRPELLADRPLSREEAKLLAEVREELSGESDASSATGPRDAEGATGS
jgi:tRNA (guanine37-N1)-methyltransferase